MALLNKGWRYSGNELNYVKEVLDSGFAAATSGSMNKRFEEAFAQKVGVRYAMTLNSGTSTLHSALAACGVGPGDEVIIPALTVVMCGYAVLYAGATPVFADVDAKTFLIDPADIERKITSRTKAIMPVHLYGQVCDMDAIMQIAQKHNLKIVEDCAESFMATDAQGRLCGTIGDAGSFSLENSKHISTGDGGVLVTNDEPLAERMRKFAGMGFKNIQAGSGQVRRSKDVFQNPSYLRHDTFGFNYRMTEVAAAVGMGQLERADMFVSLRRRAGLGFLQVIQETGCDWLVPQYTPSGYVNTYWTFALQFEGKEKRGIEWADFRKKYLELGGDGIYSAWALVYNEPIIQMLGKEGKFFPGLDTKQGGQFMGMCDNVQCPNAESLQPKMMHLPTNQFSEEEILIKMEALRKTIQFFS